MDIPSSFIVICVVLSVFLLLHNPAVFIHCINGSCVSDESGKSVKSVESGKSDKSCNLVESDDTIYGSIKNALSSVSHLSYIFIAIFNGISCTDLLTICSAVILFMHFISKTMEM